MGATALLYSRADTNVGKRAFVDGLSVSSTTGVIDVSALFAQEDNTGSQDNKIYALRAGYNPSENLSWGLTLGRYQNAGAESTNRWAADGTYKFGKSSLTAEYTKSSSNADNKLMQRPGTTVLTARQLNSCLKLPISCVNPGFDAQFHKCSALLLDRQQGFFHKCFIVN